MMPEFFSETETNTGATEAKKVKKLLFWSYALKVVSLLFVVLSAVFSPYYLIGFAIFMMSGIAMKQSVLERTASFEYFFVRDTLKITDRACLIYEGKVFLEGEPEYITENKDAKKFYLGEDFTW